MNLLIKDTPIHLLPVLIMKVGINGAIFLQHLHSRVTQSSQHQDGHMWVCNSYADWVKELPFWSNSTIKRITYDLESKGYIFSTSDFNKMKNDHTKWYRINYKKFMENSTSTDVAMDLVVDDEPVQVDMPVSSNWPVNPPPNDRADSIWDDEPVQVEQAAVTWPANPPPNDRADSIWDDEPVRVDTPVTSSRLNEPSQVESAYWANVSCSSTQENNVRTKDLKTLSTKKIKDCVEKPLDAVSVVVNYLNQRTGKQFRANTVATKKLIRARFRENYTVADFKRVIDSKVFQWQHDAKFCRYLRPSTLFSAVHFENYLNESRPAVVREIPSRPVLDFTRGEDEEALLAVARTYMSGQGEDWR